MDVLGAHIEMGVRALANKTQWHNRYPARRKKCCNDVKRFFSAPKHGHSHANHARAP
jgi:hypothetical protein